jgi:hypothetical protein
VRASFRVCASSTMVPLEARLFSYHLRASDEDARRTSI